MRRKPNEKKLFFYHSMPNLHIDASNCKRACFKESLNSLKNLRKASKPENKMSFQVDLHETPMKCLDTTTEALLIEEKYEEFTNNPTSLNKLVKHIEILPIMLTEKNLPKSTISTFLSLQHHTEKVVKTADVVIETLPITEHFEESDDELEMMKNHLASLLNDELSTDDDG